MVLKKQDILDIESDKNQPNFRRRNPFGIFLVLSYPIIQAIIWILGKKVRPENLAQKVGDKRESILIYQSYQVGDFFMALPAIIKLSGNFKVTVLCRKDCQFVLNNLGIDSLVHENTFLASSGLSTFINTIKSSLILRQAIANINPILSLDFESDPRTAIFLKIAGAPWTISYTRSFGWFFDQTFPLTLNRSHQSEKSIAISIEIQKIFSKFIPKGILDSEKNNHEANSEKKDFQKGSNYFILSCWTRKEEKNWPFQYWNEVLKFISGKKISVQIVVPPEKNSDFLNFKIRWEKKSGISFFEGDLKAIYQITSMSRGIIATDNFLGHMGAYLKKPVFWINGSSNPLHVGPLSPKIKIVQFDPMPCRPCYHRCSNPIHIQCLKELKPKYVIEQLKEWVTSL